jgi:hypothetical protein
MPESGPADQSASDPAPGTPDVPAIPEETLKAALTAFKKRLKLTILDHESRLGAHRPTSSGKKADVQGIIPPTQFPPQVWWELARQGKIKSMNGGFYKLP